MKLIDVIPFIIAGGVACRKDWYSSAGSLLGVDGWYVMLSPVSGMITVFEKNHTERGDLKMTKENFESNDWEIIQDTYEIELAALKKKHGRD